jgi:para-aminobenzoate synthetase component I
MNPTTATPTCGPLEAARAMRRREGFVFLDSVLSGPGAVSLLACEPDFVMEGRDWKRLEAEVLRWRQYRNGSVFGWVAYEGGYRFGFYHQVHRFFHDSGEWDVAPGLFEETGEADLYSPLFKAETGRDEFVAMAVKAQEYIAAGDIYQVCLSHRFTASGNFNAWQYYELLRQYSPAPHAAYMDGGGVKVVSASPECFLNMCGRDILTRPIKGTRPRATDDERDRTNSSELVNSPKEIAELTMITDLERNDLGRVCEYGSVEVPALLQLEAFRQVFHLVSTVRGRLREDVSHVQALQECFPGGSITGAPKKRAMEIIAELEPVPRGIYTGAIGYFGCDGTSQFSIAIRTAIFEREHAHFHVGAGIVADSVPGLEWEETWHKASGLLLGR